MTTLKAPGGMKSARLAVVACGQAALIHAIAGASAQPPAQAPSGPASDQGATVTMTKR